jgi:hypothetical protein
LLQKHEGSSFSWTHRYSPQKRASRKRNIGFACADGNFALEILILPGARLYVAPDRSEGATTWAIFSGAVSELFSEATAARLYAGRLIKLVSEWRRPTGEYSITRKIEAATAMFRQS